MTRLPPDFRDFLRLLNEHRVDYLLIGGYAVSYHGYPRATAGMDVWVNRTDANAAKLLAALRDFGFAEPPSDSGFLPGPDEVIRMGVPPMRIELVTAISGVDFAACHANLTTAVIDGVEVNVLSLEDLKKNKRAAGRHKDLADLEQLP